MEIIIALMALAVGTALGYLIGSRKSSALSARHDMAQELYKQAKAESSALAGKVDVLTEEGNRLSAQVERLADRLRSQTAAIEQERSAHKNQIAELKDTHGMALKEKQAACDKAMALQEQNHQVVVEAMQARFDETMRRVTAQMKAATEDMLAQRQKEFSESSHRDIGQIVNPLRETIDRMKQAMSDSTLKQTAMNSELKANIENLMRQSQAAKESADELARAFKHGAKVQGDWGEMVLDEFLQSQGLTPGIHYDTQTVIKDATGNTVRSKTGGMMRPDVILHLDQRRELIIDAKVSLTAFMDYVNAEDGNERQRALKAHIDSIQKHVKELSQKDYSSYIAAPKVKMDYVIMFVPHSGALWTALQAQPDLWRKAMEKNVFVADEQTLFAALRIIQLTWTQIAQAQNHEKVYALANEMLNRVGQFWAEYQAMGKALDNAHQAWEKGRDKISSGGRSINTTANQLIRLGARQSDKNPIPQLLDIDDIPTIDSAL